MTAVAVLIGVAAGNVQAAEPAASPVVREAVMRLLDAGFQKQRQTPQSLDQIYLAGQREIGGEHPYLHYAYALTLTKNFAAAQAGEHLQAAAVSDDPVILPAREELIHAKLMQSRFVEALDGISRRAGRN
jgi:hypothetical protein